MFAVSIGACSEGGIHTMSGSFTSKRPETIDQCEASREYAYWAPEFGTVNFGVVPAKEILVRVSLETAEFVHNLHSITPQHSTHARHQPMGPCTRITSRLPVVLLARLPVDAGAQWSWRSCSISVKFGEWMVRYRSRIVTQTIYVPKKKRSCSRLNMEPMPGSDVLRVVSDTVLVPIS